MRQIKCLLVLTLAILSARSFAQTAGDRAAKSGTPSYTAVLAGGKSIVLKVNAFSLYSLLNLTKTPGKDLPGSVLAAITVVVSGKTVVLTSNANTSFTYTVTTNKHSGAATAKGKGDHLTFNATSDNSKSFLSAKIDITAVASQLPQTTKGKPKPTLIGASNFTLIIGSASFVGTIDSKGKVSFP